MRAFYFVPLCLLAALALSPRAHAAESYANCTGFVTKIPTVIPTSGTWCLKQDLTTASAAVKAITIKADNVTLDCNDFVLSETAGGTTTAEGIYGANRLNATVRHCNVRGFKTGIHLLETTSGGGHVIEDNIADSNTSTGIRVEGDGSIVRRNQVFSTGGSTSSPAAYGIYTSLDVNVADNTVSDVIARIGGNGSVYGIYTAGNVNGSITGNRVRGLAKDGTGKSFGIFNAAHGRITLRDNDVFGDTTTGSVGLTCVSSIARAKNNEINGFVIGLKSCGDAGQNDVTP